MLEVVLEGHFNAMYMLIHMQMNMNMNMNMQCTSHAHAHAIGMHISTCRPKALNMFILAKEEAVQKV